ncbi:MAG TPA: AAA family ATPase [Aestuariivirga sp.]|jgi:pilus assembly protein CpaE|nr:AAA family ATPase [Aestuariivirga sp.]
MTASAHQISAHGADHHPVVMVPHVNIHNFCDNQQTGEILQQAAMDRRMGHAHVSIQLGGITAAIQVYHHQPTPNVLVVETHAGRDQLLNELGQLAEVCQPTTKVIVIGHVNDVILYRELMRQGISEYIVAPITALQYIESVASLYKDPKSDPLGRIFAFVGAKGGVGSSTIAHNIAYRMSGKHSVETVITDLDLSFGTAGLNFNQDANNGMVEALGQPDRVDSTLIDRLLTKIGTKLSLLGGPCQVDREFSIEAQSVETVLNALRRSVPCIIVDVPNVWAPWVRYTLINADEVIITATPDLACLRNTKNMVDLLKQARPNDHLPRIVLNQVGVPKRPEVTAADFAKAIGITPSLVIPYDPVTFGTAQSNGQMLVEVGPKSKPAEQVDMLADILSGNSRVAAKSGGKFNLNEIFQKLPSLRKK